MDTTPVRCPTSAELGVLSAVPAARRPDWPTGSFAIDGILISTIAFGIALTLLGRLLLDTGFELADAERAIWYLAFFPTSYFFSMPMTESLFLMLSVGAILAAARGRWWLAGIIGGLAALTRWPGVLLIVPLAILFFERRERNRAQLLLSLRFSSRSPAARSNRWPATPW